MRKRLSLWIESIIRSEIQTLFNKYHCNDCGTRIGISRVSCQYCGKPTHNYDFRK